MKAPTIFVLAPALLAAACATAPASRSVQVPAEPAAVAAEPSRHCLRETGSRIEPAAGQCAIGPGRVITREDLERSGAMTTSEALNRTVH